MKRLFCAALISAASCATEQGDNQNYLHSDVRKAHGTHHIPEPSMHLTERHRQKPLE